MQFQFNSDNNIESDQRLETVLEDILRSDLEHFAGRVTRVEVHLSDENSRIKAGSDDKKCVVEVRLAGLDPRSASHTAESLEEAVRGASSKIKRQMEKTLGRMSDKRREKPAAFE